MSDLRSEVARVRVGAGDGRAMVDAFRVSVLLVPRLADGSVCSGDYGGVRWLYAFTTRSELATWVLARGNDGAAEQPYLTVRGSRLLDVAIPEMGMPAGIAIDVAGSQPMMLPPVRGIVPEDLAVDSGSWGEVA